MILPLLQSSSASMKMICKSQRMKSSLLLSLSETKTFTAIWRRYYTRSSQSSDSTRIDMKRSPYVILELRKSATKDDIKSQFRKLAKENHPDLNPHLPSHVTQSKMSELIHAYNMLMDDELFIHKVGVDNRVALACEMFTLEELKMDRFHHVFSIRIRYNNNDVDHRYHNDNGSDMVIHHDRSKKYSSSFDLVSNHHQTVLIDQIFHPNDSISDVKRQLQLLYQKNWGLEGRKLDRDKIAIGWEIAREINRHDGDTANNNTSLEVMSYHLFLHSYGISDGDIIHAVIRKE